MFFYSQSKDFQIFVDGNLQHWSPICLSSTDWIQSLAQHWVLWCLWLPVVLVIFEVDWPLVICHKSIWDLLIRCLWLLDWIELVSLPKLYLLPMPMKLLASWSRYSLTLLTLDPMSDQLVVRVLHTCNNYAKMAKIMNCINKFKPKIIDAQ